jgi:hypothetical protein
VPVAPYVTIRRISERHALVVAGNAPPIIAKLRRCFDGKDGRQLTHQLDTARTAPGRLPRENRLSPNGLDDLTGRPTATANPRGSGQG